MTQLDPFQYETLDFLDKAHGRAVVADPMGARKTGTILSWLSQTLCGPTLIVAPSCVHRHWQVEASRFYPEALAVIGTGSKRLDALDSVVHMHAANPVYITTYESHKLDAATLLGEFDTVVYDEAHRLKGRTTQIAKASNLFAKRCRNVVCATGTPVINRPDELWQYLHMLAPQYYRSFWKWVEYHFEITYARYQGRMGPETKVIGDYLDGHEDIVRNEIAPFILQRDLADLFPGEAWIEEPEHVAIECPLSGHERKVYDNLVKHSWGITTTGKEIVAENAVALNTRLQQIASDWGTLDDQLTLGSKSKAAVEKIEDLVASGKSVVVFAKYRQTVSRIGGALAAKRIGVVAYTGTLTAQQRDKAVDWFKAGDARVIVGTLDSMSEGVDGLQAVSDTVVMVDRHWTAAKNDQCIGRVKRSGQKRKVTVFHVYAEGTIDYSVVEACLTKTNVAQVLKNKPLIDAIYGK